MKFVHICNEVAFLYVLSSDSKAINRIKDIHFSFNYHSIKNMALKISNEIKVGIIGLITLALLVYGMNFLKGTSLVNKSTTLYVDYDNVGGLLKGASVLYNGYTIGKVNNLSLDAKTHKIRAEIIIQEDMGIPNDSKAIIYSAGLMGPIAIRLDMGKSEKVVEDEGTIEGGLEGTMTENLENKVDPIRMQVEVLSKQLNNIAGWVNYTLDSTGSRNTILEILDNANASTESVKGVTKDLDKVIAGVNKAVESVNLLANSTNNVVSNLDNNKGNINSSIAKLDGTMTNVKSLSDSLAMVTKDIKRLMAEAQTAVAQVQSSLDNVKGITAGLQNGEGSAGKLLKDDALYANAKNSIARLDSAVITVNNLLEEIKANPKKYLNVKVVVFENKHNKE